MNRKGKGPGAVERNTKPPSHCALETSLNNGIRYRESGVVKPFDLVHKCIFMGHGGVLLG